MIGFSIIYEYSTMSRNLGNIFFKQKQNIDLEDQTNKGKILKKMYICIL